MPALPAVDATLTMWPRPRGSIRRAASRVPWIIARVLMAKIRSMVASSSSSRPESGITPALLM